MNAKASKCRRETKARFVLMKTRTLFARNGAHVNKDGTRYAAAARIAALKRHGHANAAAFVHR